MNGITYSRLELPEWFRVKDTISATRQCLTFRGVDERSGRQAAVKSLRPVAWLSRGETAARIEEFVTALNLVAALDADGLLPNSEIHAGADTAWAMRTWVDGESLAARIERGRPLSLAEVSRIASQCASALDSLAARGLSHGNLNGGNLLLTPDGTVVVTDSSFSREAARVSIAGVRCRREPREERSDLRSLAALLYRAVTGAEATPRAVTASWDLPLPVRQTFARALRDGGFHSAREFASALQPSTGSPIFRLVWRPAAAAGLLGSLVTVGGLARSDKELPAQKVVHAAPAPPAASAPVAAAIKPIDSGVIGAGDGLVSAPAVVAAKPLPLTDEDQRALQLAIRRYGPAALSNPAIADLLQLGDSQRDEVATLLTDQRRQVGDLVESASARRISDLSDAMRTLRARTGARMLALLADDQRAAWKIAAQAPVAPGEPIL